MSGTSGERVARDPFGPAASPSAYVPFAATEQALREIEASLRAGRVAALIGPPGLGKSLLFHRLASQERQLQALYVPYCTLSLAELSSFALGLLGWSGGPDPVVALAQHARSLGARRSGVLLLIDDAGAMPLETAFGLEGVLKLAGGTLRIALAASDSEEAQRVCAAFAPDLDEIRLERGLTEDEAHAYVQTRLDAAQADAALRSAFDREAVDALYRDSEGVPRRLDLAAQAIVRRVLGEQLPRLADSVSATPIQDAAPEVMDSMRSRVAALLANEPDVQQVVASLHTTPPPAAEQPVAESQSGAPQAAPEPAAEAEPVPPQTAAVAAASRAEVPSPPRAPVEETSPAEPVPPPRDEEPPRESKVGTYRMVRPAGEDLAAEATPDTAGAQPQEVVSEAGASLRAPLDEGVAASAEPADEAPQEEIAAASAPKEDPLQETLFLSTELAEAHYKAASAEPKAPQPDIKVADAFKQRAPTAPVADDAGDRKPAVAEDVASPAPEPPPPSTASRWRRAKRALRNMAAAMAGVAVGVAFLWAWVQFDQVSPGDETSAPARLEKAKSAAPPEPAREARTRAESIAARPVTPTPRPTERPEPATPAPAPTARAQEPGAALAPPAIVRVGINAIPWAVIEVDGIELGETPLAGIGIPAGPHTFRARMPDGSIREQVVEIDATNRHVVFE
jgi:hypothetical protein